eukprot:TRINITY_DN2581_c0_g1_i1.p1 TRINITY_DN2581_c0_g1~~TRINITY_DN2581_c0_g1_i1.p1  ORF type:complete len:684 (+),score=177.11 TRINITY_DN2581_c0_g1_i1:104-2053(+)
MSFFRSKSSKSLNENNETTTVDGGEQSNPDSQNDQTTTTTSTTTTTTTAKDPQTDTEPSSSTNPDDGNDSKNVVQNPNSSPSQNHPKRGSIMSRFRQKRSSSNLGNTDASTDPSEGVEETDKKENQKQNGQRQTPQPQRTPKNKGKRKLTVQNPEDDEVPYENQYDDEQEILNTGRASESTMTPKARNRRLTTTQKPHVRLSRNERRQRIEEMYPRETYQHLIKEEIDTPLHNARRKFKTILLRKRLRDAEFVEADADVMKSGFRPSTLAEVEKQGYSIENVVLPQLKDNGLEFLDLQLDHETQYLVTRPNATTFRATVLQAEYVPLPPPGRPEGTDYDLPEREIAHRKVRVALYNKKSKKSEREFYGNVHSIRGSYMNGEKHTWKFLKRGVGDDSVETKLNENSCLVRSEQCHPDLYLLFELVVVYKVRQPNLGNALPDRVGDDYQELSCGWCAIRLYDENMTHADFTTYELPLNGGTPFDEEGQLLLDDDMKGDEYQNVFLAKMRNKRVIPTLKFKLSSLSLPDRTDASLLPDSIICAQSTVGLIVYFRELLIDTFLIHMNQESAEDLGYVHDVVLSYFPKMLQQPDILEELKARWDIRYKSLKNAEKNSSRMLSRRKHFLNSFVAHSLQQGLSNLSFGNSCLKCGL